LRQLRSNVKQRDTGKAFVFGHRQEHLFKGGIVENLECLLFVLKQSGRAEDLETVVNADQKLRRTEPALNGACLRAFYLAGNAAQLAGGKHVGLDPAVGILGDCQYSVMGDSDF
jgi:hypothetical protein